MHIPQDNNNLMVPVSIVVAGVLIAGAVIFTSGNRVNNNVLADPDSQQQDSTSEVRPVDSTDHILGDPNALVKIIEFSDLECPFCKGFHDTMKQIMREYGDTSQVAWIYRHFPLDSIHPKARIEAEATECAAELGGNESFWLYTDRIFEITPSNNGLNLNQLPEIAEYIGLDKSEFEACLASGKYADHIASDLQDGINTGGRGTPWSIIIAPNGKTFSLNGAQPFSTVRQIIEIALKEN